MVQKPKSFAEYQSDILTALAATGIRQLAPGGKARAFGDIVADKLGELENNQFVNLGQTLLPFATGTSLDLLGEVYGINRIQQSASSVDASDGNFRFYVRRGTFGDVNNGKDITVPAGVRITTDDENGPVYLSEMCVLLAGQSEQYFGASSLYTGAAGNTAAKVFTRHNFTNYAEAPYGSLLVSNDYGLVGGRDEEDDESYRYRIYLHIRSASGTNETALRFALLQVPGIQDIVFERRAGTFLVYVYGITPAASSSLIANVQQVIDDQAAYPITGVAVSPDLVGISLVTTLRLNTTPTLVEQDTILAAARNEAALYINNLGVGEPLIINEIADRIRNSDARILDIGEPNRQLPEIFIWRSRSDATRYSRFLVGNYQPQSGERIMVEDRANAIGLSVTA